MKIIYALIYSLTAAHSLPLLTGRVRFENFPNFVTAENKKQLTDTPLRHRVYSDLESNKADYQIHKKHARSEALVKVIFLFLNPKTPTKRKSMTIL